MVRIKIRIIRLVHHLAAHYTLLSAHDTSLVRDRRETEKSTCCDSVAPVLISAIATNGLRADSLSISITLAEAPPSNHLSSTHSVQLQRHSAQLLTFLGKNSTY